MKLKKDDKVNYGDKSATVIINPYEDGLVWIEFDDTKENRLINSKDLLKI